MVEAKVIGQKILSKDVKLIEVFAPEIARIAKPGQFVNVQVSKQAAPLLRRPFGVAGVDSKTGTLTMIYRIMGEATKILADLCSGDIISIIGPLGHALALNRVAGIEFDVAALTNITQDHLDFHGTFEKYREAKAILFTNLHIGSKKGKTAVFNTDDYSAKTIMERTKTPIMTYGKAANNDVYPLAFEVAAKHMRLNLSTPVGEMDLLLHITGEFNVYNVMTAVAVMLAEKIDKKIIIDVLDGFAGVPGRFQLVEAGQPYTVIVDYAHTPDGLDNVLKTARQITRGKLWAVFGCGGDRDNKKRPIMGRIALELADNLVVTSDNPRSENPELIILDIEKGLAGAPAEKKIHKITDRKEAIEFALSHAEPDDVIMIAGKGHENYQILRDRTIHFDDCEVVRDYWHKRS